MNLSKSMAFAKTIKLQTLKMIYEAKSSHIGSCFSMADILAVLYSSYLNNHSQDSSNPTRDRYFQGKGHASAILYATLAQKGFLDVKKLDHFGQDGQILGGHVTYGHVAGVELSTGALGHALPVANGVALCAKREKKKYKTYVLLGDGEMNEGSNWEAMMFAAQHRLSNLCVIIDYNKLQGLGSVDQIMGLHPLKEKIESFGWHVHSINGHDHQQIHSSFTKFIEEDTDKPFCILANTIKGKGVSFMEGEVLWHYKPPNEEQYLDAKSELEREYA